MSEPTEPAGGSPDPLSEPVFCTLLALARGKRHGYAIIQDVEEWTGGRVKLRTATLYTALRRLVDDGLVEETAAPDPEADARRRYYRLTPAGEEVLRAETGRLREMVGLAEELAREVAGG